MNKIIALGLLLFGVVFAAGSIEDAAQQLSDSISPKLKGKTVAVLDFENPDNRVSELGRIFALQYLSERLSFSGINSVARDQIDKILQELKLSQSGLVQKITGGERVALQGVDGLITGRISELGDQFIVTVTALDSKSGLIIAVARTQFPKIISYKDAYDKIIIDNQNKPSPPAPSPVPPTPEPIRVFTGVPINSTSITEELGANEVLYMTSGQFQYAGQFCRGQANNICVLIIQTSKPLRIVVNSLIPEQNYYYVSKGGWSDSLLRNYELTYWIPPNCGIGCLTATIFYFKDGQFEKTEFRRRPQN